MNSKFQIGYCGNVHPAVSVNQLIGNLQQQTTAVKQLLGQDQPMPFGLWVSASTLSELQSQEKLARLKDTLARADLVPFTVNGFPFGDFHQPVVKQSVYSPDWTDPARLNYTLQLADLHHQLLPPDAMSTISTLPLGWPSSGKVADEFYTRSADNLAQCAMELHRRFEHTGRKHLICIEPEPGCVLDCCGDVVEFFERFLIPRNEATILSHIGICHDVCHSAVMFESQSEAIAAYTRAGIQIGKIQVSSAVETRFVGLDTQGKSEALQKLRSLCEPKYLHQTSIEHEDGRRDFYVDLPDALAENDGTGIWRVHFHVPIFFGAGTTQRCIAQCLDAMKAHNVNVSHFEVETYAWPVLPAGVFSGTIDQGIAKEIRWFADLISQE